MQRLKFQTWLCIYKPLDLKQLTDTTAFYNKLLYGRQTKAQKGCEDEEQEVINYWTTLRKGEDTGNWNTKHWTALCEELAVDKSLGRPG
jgi:hypothetical protein